MGKLRRWLGRGRDERIRREVDEEIHLHLELRERELRDRGESPEDARVHARRRFDEDLEGARRRLYASARRRDRRRGVRERLYSVLQDARLTARRARTEPGHALFTIATLALGIGLTTGTFTLVEGVLLSPLPFPEPDRLVSLRSVNEDGSDFPYVSSTNWFDWRDGNRTLVATGIHGFPRRMTVGMGESAFRVDGVSVGGRFFDVMRIPMLLGRGLTETEIEARQSLAVVSEGFWREVLGADPELSREITVDGWSVRVIGVVRRGYAYPEGVRIWMPGVYRRMSGAARNNINWLAVGRLRPGVTVEEARADLSAIADRIRAEEPAGIYSWGVGVLPLRDELVGGSRRTLWLLLGAATSVLLIACANLAGLGLARCTASRGETAVRLALGASRIRIAQQQVVEQLLLAGIGGLLGLAAADALVRRLTAGGVPLARTAGVAVNGAVVLFAVGVTLTAGLLSSALPALRSSRAGLRAAMVAGARSVAGARTLPGAALVGSEIALAVVLLVGGGLLVRSYVTLTGRQLGYDPDRVVTASIALTSSQYRGDPKRWSSYWDRLLVQLRGTPGLESVALTSAPPAGDDANGFIEVEGLAAEGIGAHYYVISNGFFHTLGIPVLAGRGFRDTDGAATERVVVVSRAMADRYWPGESPLGRRVRATSMEGWMAGGASWLTVVGVVGDTRQWGFVDDADARMYVLYRQVPERTGAMTVIARAGVDVGAATSTLRRQIVALDPAIAPDIDTLDGRLGGLLTARRVVLSTLNLFAGLAVALACIGLYGLLSFAVTRRRREIAVRAALGASGASLLALVLRGAVRVAVAGLAVGLVAAWWLARLLESMLVDVTARDPVTFGAVAVALLAVAVLAALVPARRAARQHPARVLRGI